VSPVVRLRSVVCLLGRFPALAGVDLDVEAGEVVLLSGGNGAGKTTLLRVVAGLVPVHQGAAEVLGTDLTRDRRGHRSRLALVGQEAAAYDDLTVLENVRFAARTTGRSDADADTVVGELGLTPLADVRHGRLSTGQRRRLGLAVGLVRRPELLLLDEPHAGLDVPGRAFLDGVLSSASDSGTAVLIASHELDLVRPVADREVVLTNGRTPPGDDPMGDPTGDPTGEPGSETGVVP
jgi:ABC-type branched-subunit amino acid transport system ATPase component